MTLHNNCPSRSHSRRGISMPPTPSSWSPAVADMDMLANTFMRAPGEAVGTLRAGVRDRRVRRADSGSIRSSCGSATSRKRIPHPVSPFSSRHLVQAYRAGAERFGWDSAARSPARGARANGSSAWDVPPRRIRITGCLAARPGSHCTRTATRRSRSRRTRWAWAPPRRRRRSPPSGSVCRSSRSRWPTATPSYPGVVSRGRIAADRLDRRGSDRRASRVGGGAADARRQ